MMNQTTNYNNHSIKKSVFNLFLLIVYTICVIVLYTKNPGNVMTNYSSLMVVLTIITSFLVFYKNLKTKDNEEGFNYAFDIIKYLVIFICYIVLVLFLYIYNPGGVFVQTFYIGILLTWITMGIMIVSFLGVFIYSKGDVNKINVDKNVIKKILSYFFLSSISVIGTVALIHWISSALANATTASGIVKLIVDLLILLFILGLVYKMIIKSELYTESPLAQFIVNSIFYIPCLLVSLVDRISRLFGMGGEGKKDSGLFKPSRTDYIVLISAVVLNVIYFTYPYVLNYFSKQGGLLLLNMPVYTNTENTLGSYIDLNNSETFAYTYAISFWVFIDSASPSMSHAYDKYTSLLNYGNKPNVLYNGKENTLMITMESPGSLTLSKDTKKAHVDDKGNQILYKKKGVLLQKWNHIVLNYTGGTMDIFFNGELEKSVDGVVPYMKYDTLTIGENNGLHGGICNVTYFNKSLTMNKIYYLYNYVKDYTPPVSENTDKTIIHIVKKDT